MSAQYFNGQALTHPLEDVLFQGSPGNIIILK